MSTLETSLAAKESIAECAGQLREKVLAVIEAAGDRGATCDEVEIALEMRHQTASARVHELMCVHRIIDSKMRRPTRSGHQAVVWRIRRADEEQPRLFVPETPKVHPVPRTLAQVQAFGGYNVVYADPCWQYEQGGRGSTDKHYPTMSIEEIQALPIAQLAARDAVLFLWGTWPQLPVVLDTMKAWGFEFKTCAFVWVKYHEPSGKRCIGGGMWTRANTEFCLLGVRGEPPRRVSKAVRQLLETDDEEKVLLAPRGRHSAKPAEARNRILELLGRDLRAIELFARCVDEQGLVAPGARVAEGWHQWGNECESDVVMSPVQKILQKARVEKSGEPLQQQFLFSPVGDPPSLDH